MRKKLITVSKVHIVSFILIMLGAFFTADGIIRSFSLQNFRTLNDINLKDLKCGTYIVDTVENVAGVYYDKEGVNGFLGAILHYQDLFMRSYSLYSIPISYQEDEYISVMVPEQESGPWNLLRNEKGSQKLDLVGKIVRLNIESNYELMMTATMSDTKSELLEKFTDRYAIIPVDPYLENLVWLKGASMIVTGILLSVIATWRRGSFTIQFKGTKKWKPRLKSENGY